ncbi:helix-turn-helix transcriptional regulator [Lentzea flava]|uniref:Transcriptional regulator n=1 Tax=Lentzea flava TaxID=103732 RepID=A0ABQ2USU4_9PSEU|nr:helix-turn-helix domain-containing protein [Lentzea flava]MCP2201346.1 Homeodomain-like domain-containing protein [Lentzea flava]GGU51667.1 transcriptional regulator [Lentzea flava]
MHQPPGLSPEAEKLYLAMLAGSEPEPGAAREELERLGLVRGDEVRPPRSALAAIASGYEAAAIRARETAEVLAKAYAEHGAREVDFVEVLKDADEVISAFEEMQSQAKTEIRALDPGSYLSPQPEASPAQPPALARGVGYRVVYDSSLLQTELGFASVQESIAVGEQARAFPGVPLKLVIADSDRALIAVPTVTGGNVVALLIHPSVLLSALIELFEAFWRMAVSITPGSQQDSHEEPTTATRRLMALLSAGLTDESIARELGVSERTVHRRVSRLQQLLGAQTRFQLGVQASRRGWL